MWKNGDYIVVVNAYQSRNGDVDYCYKHNGGPEHYIRLGPGTTINTDLVKVRNATVKEIAHYDKVGKPYNINDIKLKLVIGNIYVIHTGSTSYIFDHVTTNPYGCNNTFIKFDEDDEYTFKKAGGHMATWNSAPNREATEEEQDWFHRCVAANKLVPRQKETSAPSKSKKRDDVLVEGKVYYVTSGKTANWIFKYINSDKTFAISGTKMITSTMNATSTSFESRHTIRRASSSEKDWLAVCTHFGAFVPLNKALELQSNIGKIKYCEWNNGPTSITLITGLGFAITNYETSSILLHNQELSHVKGFRTDNILRDATSEESVWLKACIKAGKFVPKDTNNPHGLIKGKTYYSEDLGAGYNWIFRFEDSRSTSAIINRERYTAELCGEFEHFRDDTGVRLATQEESNWLENCVSHDELVPLNSIPIVPEWAINERYNKSKPEVHISGPLSEGIWGIPNNQIKARINHIKVREVIQTGIVYTNPKKVKTKKRITLPKINIYK